MQEKDQAKVVCKLPKPEVCADETSHPSPPRRLPTPSIPAVYEFSVPQHAPGASAAIGHTLENSIPLSIFPIATDKFWYFELNLLTISLFFAM